jgi:predicted phosphodiesterase
MPVAALYDIHGNLPALEAVLDEIGTLDVDLIVVGGDVLPGPMFGYALDLLLRIPVPTRFILGNCEVAVLETRRGALSEPVPESARQIIEWTANALTARQVDQISQWPLTLRMHVSALGAVLFCHGTPRHPNEIFTERTPEEQLRPVFDTADASLVVCGHTHMQFDRRVAGTRVVNAGSVGMPFGGDTADWLLLGNDLELRQTRYNREVAADRIRRTDYPQAAQFADHSVLRPPSREQMIEVFTAAELRYGTTP